MIPQILRQLGNNSLISQIKQAKAMLGAMGNPQAVLTQIVNNNPMIRQIISQYGSVDGAITALCQQKGINPQELADALK